ncbi:hypothetical protein THRCLA_23186 [Thraustotheca clavata]|uniref:Endonuclease/exonuclease/phosphatase domain-containing protein n=1 Tax=Thraustotheca clavata TaxID=74557 RepID=A0A1V9YBM5_9STRA|nr:hypothetical protein THRCLA_23186 [Thraustotheca clavata]
MGDFNFPMDRLVDSISGQSNHHTAREECFAWLQELHVLDAWRVHHPTARVYSSPKRNNRLDYIFVDELLCQESYHSSEYFEPSDPTDHLWHKVVLQTVAHSRCKGYWKLPKELLENPDIKDAIIHEAKALLDTLRTSADPGTVWQIWKRKTKRFLQKMHTRHQVTKRNSLQTAHIQWLQAQWKHNHGQLSLNDFNTAK